MISRLSFLIALSALGTSACTTKMAYLSMQAMQREECDQNPDMQERQRCMARTNTSYEDYVRQREGMKPAR